MRRRLALFASCAALLALSAGLAVPARAAATDPGPYAPWLDTPTAAYTALTTKAPYRPQGSLSTYQQAPAGFVPVFTENVSRHGARTLSDSDDGDALLAVWTIAKAQGGLTAVGKKLGPDVEQLLAANAKVGYGLLTQSGKDELTSTATRLAQRLPTLFASVNGATTPRIDVLAASQQRTVDSAKDFVQGLTAADPGLAGAIGPVTTDDNLLYFHKSDQAYQDYVNNDPRIAAAEDAARDQPRSHAAARDVLDRSFTKAFVKRIAAGEFTQFSDDIAAADAVYNLWAVTKDMTGEGNWHFGHYISTADAAWFGYLDDVESFYENGPAFTGSDVTYRMAGVLLDDMFAQLDAKRAGTSDLAAVLRFTHAEEIFPLVALLGLPGSTTQLPTGTEFTYANDPFRGAQVAPMAANIQWDLFRNGNTYLVRMLYNEKQTRFKASCTPVTPGSYFYSLDELQSCYGYPLPTS